MAIFLIRFTKSPLQRSLVRYSWSVLLVYFIIITCIITYLTLCCTSKYNLIHLLSEQCYHLKILFIYLNHNSLGRWHQVDNCSPFWVLLNLQFVFFPALLIGLAVVLNVSVHIHGGFEAKV